MPGVWFISDIADALQSGLRTRFAEIDAEQAVYGIDALQETDLHPVIDRCFTEAGYGSYREIRYPADRTKGRLSTGRRCDLVLTKHGQPLQVEAAESTLFDAQDAVPHEDAFWMEVKIAHQYRPGGANRNYASQLAAPVRADVAKLAADPGILHAGVLLILFTASEEIARHDGRMWQERCLHRALPIAAPSWRHISMSNRIGNANCSFGLFPVSHL